ncbi:MAG: HEAT repeat domain-containing protein [Gemmataceae bacterium]|nr:HEAT repeat domain-containing protein [Gemmataceae bacterium]
MDQNESSSGMMIAIIIGGAVLVLVLVVIIFGAGFFFLERGAPVAGPAPILTPVPGPPSELEIGGKTFNQWLAQLQSADAIERLEAVRFVQSFGDKYAVVVPAFVDVLKKSDDVELKQQILRGLGAMGKEADAAVPDLIAMLEAKSSELRLEAAQALGNIGANEATPALTKLLQDENPQDRDAATLALKRTK